MQDEKLNNRNEKVEEAKIVKKPKPSINLSSTEEVEEQIQGVCPYWMTPNCPMTATMGAQFTPNGMYQPQEFSPMGFNMPNMWSKAVQNPYDYSNGVAQYTSPNYVSDVWSQNQSNCSKNCTQDMYVGGAMPTPTYMPNYMQDMGMPMQNNSMYQPQMSCTKRNNNCCCYGACCSPYGLGRY